MMWKKLMGFVDVDPNPKTDFLERRKLYIVGKETCSVFFQCLTMIPESVFSAKFK